MGVFRRLAIIILSISLFTFIALFGHIPRLRKTPIGWAHRFIWITLPRILRLLDRRVTGGVVGPMLWRSQNYLLGEKHPLVMAFYLALVSGGTFMFIHDGWHHLSSAQKLYVMLILPLPYTTLYAAATSDPGIITPANHSTVMVLYPFDLVNFFPSNKCRTCKFVKPARSKHCNVCKVCVAKHDHHCAWINNCVGLLNTRHFLLFLFATDLFLNSGQYLTFAILRRSLHDAGIPLQNLTWGTWVRYFGLAIVNEVYIGAVFLLSGFTGVLSWAFTIYHVYLIWAGTTTNETSKWSDWKDDINDGLVMIADPADSSPDSPSPDSEIEEAEEADLDRAQPVTSWPGKSSQCLFRISAPGKTEELPRDALWRRIESLDEVDNIYDIGWRGNFADMLWPRPLH